MGEAPGSQLSKIWDTMELEDQVNVMESLVDVDAKLLSASFESFGGIYYAESLDGQGQLAGLRGDLPDSVKDKVRHKFALGPTVERLFWKKERQFMDIDRGPCVAYFPFAGTSANGAMESCHRLPSGYRQL